MITKIIVLTIIFAIGAGLLLIDSTKLRKPRAFKAACCLVSLLSWSLMFMLII